MNINFAQNHFSYNQPFVSKYVLKIELNEIHASKGSFCVDPPRARFENADAAIDG